MRTLLATTCLTPIVLCAALPAAAQTTISDARTAPVTTATANNGAPDDVIITETGSISFRPNQTDIALEANSANSVTNRGTISGTDGFARTGLSSPGGGGNVENSGTIDFNESATAKDADGDGDADGDFAANRVHNGINAAGGTKSVSNTSTGVISVVGNNSSGIVAGEITGNVTNQGVVNVIGAETNGIRVTGAINGSVTVGGTVFAQGADANGVFVDGAISGALVLDGTIKATGYRYPDPTAPGLTIDVSKLDVDDLLRGGSAVKIAADVAGGVLVKTGADITSLGTSPALAIGADNKGITLGPVANSEGFGLVIDGTVNANTVYAHSFSVTAVQTGALGFAVDIAKGIRINGSVTATSIDGAASALIISKGTTAPLIQIAGTVSAQTDGFFAEAIIIDSISQVNTITNTGNIRSHAGGGLDSGSIAIDDSSGTLSLIENSGIISATGAEAAKDNAAILAESNTSGLTINQSVVADGAAAPSIIGGIRFGSGVNKLNLADGSLFGDVSFLGGNNTITLSGDATMTGSTSFAGGNDVLSLGGTSQLTGDVDFGAGANTLTLSGSATMAGNSLFGVGNDSVSLTGVSAVTGSLALGEGENQLGLSDGSALAGTVSFGAGNDQVFLAGTSTLSGLVSFADGNNRLLLSDGATLKGSARFGSGNDSVSLADRASLEGDIDFGGGANTLILAGGSKLNGDILLGGGDNVVSLSGTSTLTGTVSAAGNGVNRIVLADGATLKGTLLFGKQGSVADNALSLAGTSAIIGNTTFFSGSNSVTLADQSSMQGLAFNDGNDKLSLSGSSGLTGNVNFGEGANKLILTDASALKGLVFFGSGDDAATLSGSATLTGNVNLGAGSNLLALAGTAQLTGLTTFGEGVNTLTLADSAALKGNVSFGDGDDTVSLAGNAGLTGNVALGGGANTLSLTGGARLAGNVSFGAGNDTMSLSGTSVYGGTADFAGGGSDTLTLAGTARFAGTLANAQNLAVAVNGGTFAAAGTGTTTIGSLSIGAAGTLGVTIDTASNTVTHYVVTGNASFAAGSKLAITLNGSIANDATYTILTAGTITGAANLTASQLSLPFLFRSTIVNAPANEIAIRVSRKTAADLGLNRSGASAYDAIIAALPRDTKVQDVFLGIADEKGFQATVASMLPDHAGGAFEAVTSGTRAMARMLGDADAPFADQGKWGYWIDGVTFNRTKSLGDTASYDVRGSGTAGGAEVKTDAGNFGLSIGYLHGTDRINGAANSVTANQYEAALYWRGNWGGLRPFARVSDATIKFDSIRHFSGMAGTEAVRRTANATWNGNLFSATAGASFDAAFGQLSLRPLISLDYYRLSEHGYSETNGGPAFNLSVDKRTSDEFAGNATLAAGYTIGSRDKGWLRAEIEGGRRQVLAGKLGATTARFDGGQSFTLVPEQRTSGWVGRVRASGGAGNLRLGAEFGREQQQGRAATSLRGTLQLGF